MDQLGLQSQSKITFQDFLRFRGQVTKLSYYLKDTNMTINYITVDFLNISTTATYSKLKILKKTNYSIILINTMQQEYLNETNFLEIKIKNLLIVYIFLHCLLFSLSLSLSYTYFSFFLNIHLRTLLNTLQCILYLSSLSLFFSVSQSVYICAILELTSFNTI